MLGRRGFMQGVVSAIAASSVIIEASPAEIQNFGGQIGAPAFSGLLGKSDPHVPMVEAGEFVYNHKQQIIGVIRNVELRRPIEEVTTVEDVFRRYQPTGLLYAEYSVVSYGPVRVRTT